MQLAHFLFEPIAAIRGSFSEIAAWRIELRVVYPHIRHHARA